jgi:hypothetical protein
MARLQPDETKRESTDRGEAEVVLPLDAVRKIEPLKTYETDLHALPRFVRSPELPWLETRA